MQLYYKVNAPEPLLFKNNNSSSGRGGPNFVFCMPKPGAPRLPRPLGSPKSYQIFKMAEFQYINTIYIEKRACKLLEK